MKAIETLHSLVQIFPLATNYDMNSGTTNQINDIL